MPLNSALWVVATPLGNLGDITFRAVEVLKKSHLILAEDTRSAGTLLKNLHITGKKFLSLHEHNELRRMHQVAARIMEGSDCALISEAGTPLMADPGYRLVRHCCDLGLKVIPVPGPCSFVAALTASGLPPYPFAFLGFLPRKQTELEKTFGLWKDMPVTLVFFERKNRILPSLQTASRILGAREYCLARELTKKFEEFIRGNLENISLDQEKLLGELTVIIGPSLAAGPASDPESVEKLLNYYMEQGLKPKDVVHRVQNNSRGWSSKEIYALMLKMRSKSH